MNLSYTEANELYSFMEINTENEKVLHKLGKAINLVDECDFTNQEDVIKFYPNNDNQVYVTFHYNPCWPDYLVDELNSDYSNLIIDSAYDEFVTVEILYESN